MFRETIELLEDRIRIIDFSFEPWNVDGGNFILLDFSKKAPPLSLAKPSIPALKRSQSTIYLKWALEKLAVSKTPEASDQETQSPSSVSVVHDPTICPIPQRECHEDAALYISLCKMRWMGTQYSEADRAEATAATLLVGLKGQGRLFADVQSEEDRINIAVMSAKLIARFHREDRTLHTLEICSQVAEIKQNIDETMDFYK
ncbi:hypothetical protein N7495_010014 [Penicillium taxi]|uniref:uncharacterized protein n=1 Tax=Penicillium taxi TaxID=168475 RepID=UPI002545795A|nr:uncharacterized protein N7495_010014 [Penicillium taxi]KAJ5885504.1 hypothetical protein N7495_010014 [Penicillium taxi]